MSERHLCIEIFDFVMHTFVLYETYNPETPK